MVSYLYYISCRKSQVEKTWCYMVAMVDSLDHARNHVSPLVLFLANKQDMIVIGGTSCNQRCTSTPTISFILPTMTKNKDDYENNDEFKIHISRVPTKFDETIVRRILVDHLPRIANKNDNDNDNDNDATIQVELIYPRPEHDQEDTEEQQEKSENHQDEKTKEKKKEHRGFGFVTFPTKELYEQILNFSVIKGGRKPNSTKMHTMHIRPYTTSPEETNQCYLWTERRCPYGEDCKFTHSGPGACLPAAMSTENNKKRGKCFAYRKGKCDKGDDCPFSHDFEPALPLSTSSIPKSEKDCISWKSKGKCSKRDSCPYRHDPKLIKKVEEKRKRKRDEGDLMPQKKKQPLCIRVFGMAYETTEKDIISFFQDCGKIQEINFPTFEDSGRSKGYCGIWFTSPKAVDKAIELNGQELLGRWLSVQAGKMYLKEWEANHGRSTEDRTAN